MNYPPKSRAAVRRAVKLLGGCTGAAETLGVTYSAVYHWTKGKRPPSLARALQISAATNQRVTASEIRRELVPA